MTRLSIPDRRKQMTDAKSIGRFLNDQGIFFEQWKLDQTLPADADQEHVLTAYKGFLDPFMERGGYKAADVICVNADQPNLLEIRHKFLKEHTHSEDEIRFFVEGSGLFWFNTDEMIFSVQCTKGDLISVPAHTAHWFDLGSNPYVKAIRIFTDQAGWVPNYTNSDIDKKYNPKYESV